MVVRQVHNRFIVEFPSDNDGSWIQVLDASQFMSLAQAVSAHQKDK
jgi:site-specific recombinase